MRGGGATRGGRLQQQQQNRLNNAGRGGDGAEKPFRAGGSSNGQLGGAFTFRKSGGEEVTLLPLSTRASEPCFSRAIIRHGFRLRLCVELRGRRILVAGRVPVNAAPLLRVCKGCGSRTSVSRAALASYECCGGGLWQRMPVHCSVPGVAKPKRRRRNFLTSPKILQNPQNSLCRLQACVVALS